MDPTIEPTLPQIGGYRLGKKGDDCPEGRVILDVNLCRTAAETLGLTVSDTWSGDNTNYAYGCSINDYGTIHFTANPAAVARASETPICFSGTEIKPLTIYNFIHVLLERRLETTGRL